MDKRPLSTPSQPRVAPPPPSVKTDEDIKAVGFQLCRLLTPLSEMGQKRGAWAGPPPPPRRARPGEKGLSADEKAEYDALCQIWLNSSLVTPQMLKEAHEAFAAHKSALEQQKKVAATATARAEQEREARATAKLTEVLVGGWA